ncbi:hypothetical protein NPIL_511621 [Nephila pilipes]|uniref:Uncharacterized protein n=1 Tax=Nephila pilipes TaxID=299642 RepID=A0A8X6QP42_NEPPI|nr:hypothetical protein NPIL_511621 [Nephila pilipes]
MVGASYLVQTAIILDLYIIQSIIAFVYLFNHVARTDVFVECLKKFDFTLPRDPVGAGRNSIRNFITFGAAYWSQSCSFVKGFLMPIRITEIAYTSITESVITIVQ